MEQIAMSCLDLDCKDPNKFSTTMPKRLVSAMSRVWEDISTSECVVQDIKQVVYTNIPSIIEHKGVIIPGLENRKGYCFILTEKKSTNWGGARLKGTKKARVNQVHPTAAKQATTIISKAVKVKEEQQQVKKQCTESGLTDCSTEEVNIDRSMEGIVVIGCLENDNSLDSDFTNNMEYLSDLTNEIVGGLEVQISLFVFVYECVHIILLKDI